MTTQTLARLDKLETHFGGGGKCLSCYDHPVRVVTIDGDTDTIRNESMPPSGCPSCGRSPVSELHIIVDEAGDDVA